jgi:Protein of unknown function (DUF3987)
MQPEAELVAKRRLITEVASLAGLRVVGEDTGSRAWPKEMSPEAYIGIPGDFVRLVEPHTEADTVALLGNLLVGAGVLFGREAWAIADGREHYPNEFLLVVGDTGAGGRKGTARARTVPVMNRVEEGFSEHRLLRGLSSAEGLIKRVSQAENEIIIPAPTRRYLVEIPEFALLLSVMKRDGNTLSPMLRQAWDGDALSVMTRKDPLEAKDVNLSISADVTPAELLGGLTATDRANGFANRFLIVLVRRSKSLPFGGGEVNYGPIVTRLHAALEAARGGGIVKYDDAARILWAEEYERLITKPRDGLRGALCARAEAHVLRLALLYALLDSAASIRQEHLMAAMSFWEYCERSIDHIFGGATGDPDADKIMAALARGPQTMTDLARIFNNNRKSDWIEAKMTMLCRSGKAFQTSKTGDRKSGILAWDIVANRS